jgi:hypothetical protein
LSGAVGGKAAVLRLALAIDLFVWNPCVAQCVRKQ